MRQIVKEPFEDPKPRHLFVQSRAQTANFDETAA